MNKNLALSRVLLKFAIVTIVFCAFISSAYSQTTYYDNYAFRIPLTTNNTLLGTSTDQTNFVALLKVVSPAFISGVCSDQTGGSTSIPAFAIIDSAYSTTTELNYQIENYDSTTGTIYFWVKVPTLYKSGSTNGNNKFYCYFGSQSPSVTHNTTWQKQTWSGVTATTSVNYSGVWHFNESPSAAAPQFSDATVNNNNLSIGSTGTVTQNTSSQIGNGITLSSTSVIDIGATGLPNTNASQTLSIWASYPAVPTSTANLIVLENSSNPATTGNGTQLGVLVNGGVTDLQAWRWANRTTPLVKLTGTPPTAVTWHHYAYVYDASAVKSYLYVDGALIAGPTSNTGNPPFSGTVDMVAFGDFINNNIGGSGLHVVGGQSYTGTMDESHIIGAVLPADWIKAEYINQSNPSAFTTAGTMQTNTSRASAVAGYLVYTWKGGSTDITLASNWTNTTSGVNNEAPINSNVSWVIPAGLSNYPVLTTSTGVYGLTIASGASVNLNGFTLSVGCNIYNGNGGKILYGSNNSSKITWNGSLASQNYYGTSTALTAQVGSMEVNNSTAGTVTINGGPLDIFNLLTITKGNLAVAASPGALTLKSSSTLSASVTAIPSAYSISGNVSVERYISGGSNTYRGYRLLSSPIYTSSSGSNYYYDLSYLPLYAPITGTNGTAGGLSKAGNPSMYLYRDNIAYSNAAFNSGNFRGINTINNSPLYNIGIDFDGSFNLHVGTGVMFFYRGNLTNIATKYLTNTSAEANVFVSTGTLNQQAVTVTNWYTQLPTLQFSTVPGNAGYSGFNLVGNPYASSIDWSTFSNTNAAAAIYGPGVGTTIYIFNEVSKLYATYNLGTSTNGGSNIISSGQGFFIKATASGASLTFNESAKTNSQVTGPTQSTGATLLLDALPVTTVTAPQYLRLQLQADSINKDENVIRFDNTAKDNFVFNEDSQYFPGSGIISLSNATSDNIPVSINAIPYPKKSKTIKLNVGATGNGTYSLNMTEIKNVPKLFDVWLIDKYKKDSTDMRKNLTYNFNITVSDTNSYGSNRFSLVIRPNPVLDLKLLNYTAIKTPDGSQLLWKTANEGNYTNFTAERSIDSGKTFTPLQSFLSNNIESYIYLDAYPVKGLNVYRIKLTDISDSIIYTSPIPIMYSNSSDNLVNNNVSLYPNPAVNLINLSIVQNNLALANSNSMSYDIKVMNNGGAIVKTATLSQATWQYDLSSLMPGTYIIQVINNNDKSLIGKSKFVKL